MFSGKAADDGGIELNTDRCNEDSETKQDSESTSTADTSSEEDESEDEPVPELTEESRREVHSILAALSPTGRYDPSDYPSDAEEQYEKQEQALKEEERAARRKRKQNEHQVMSRPSKIAKRSPTHPDKRNEDNDFAVLFKDCVILDV